MEAYSHKKINMKRERGMRMRMRMRTKMRMNTGTKSKFKIRKDVLVVILCLSLVAVLLLVETIPTSTTTSEATGDGVSMAFVIGQSSYTINGVVTQMDVSPTVIEDRTMLPIRFVAEPLGAVVGWDGPTSKVTVQLMDTKIELWIGQSNARVNGATKPIDPDNPNVKPLTLNDRTMLPVRFVAENLGCDVGWLEATQQVTVTSASGGGASTAPGSDLSGAAIDAKTTPAPDEETPKEDEEEGADEGADEGEAVGEDDEEETPSLSQDDEEEDDGEEETSPSASAPTPTLTPTPKPAASAAAVTVEQSPKPNAAEVAPPAPTNKITLPKPTPTPTPPASSTKKPTATLIRPHAPIKEGR